MNAKNRTDAFEIARIIDTDFVPMVGVKEMKVYLLDNESKPTNPKKIPNEMVICRDGWGYVIETREMDCREVLISGIRRALIHGEDRPSLHSEYKVALHPPKLGDGMPDKLIHYPTKAVPYLHMGSFEVRAKYFNRQPEVMAKWVDVLVGILSVILDRSEATRRAFKEGYLEPGMFESIQERGDGYTFEYHSLSSYWSRCPELISLITAHMRIAARLSLAEYEKKQAINAFWERTDYDEIRDIIQNYDFERALDVYNKLKQCMVQASKRSTDPMNPGINKLYLFDYVITRGIDSIWSSVDIASNFHGQNGWFTGLAPEEVVITEYFLKANAPLPSIGSIILPESIQFTRGDS